MRSEAALLYIRGAPWREEHFDEIPRYGASKPEYRPPTSKSRQPFRARKWANALERCSKAANKVVAVNFHVMIANLILMGAYF